MATGSGTGTTAGGSTSYGTVTQLREMLPQVPASATTDVLLGELLTRATRVAEGRLGFAFAEYGAAAAKDFVGQGSGSQVLVIPAHRAASLTALAELECKGLASEWTTALTDWVELEEEFTAGARLYRYWGWRTGWYRATGVWGYGPAPVEVVQVVLELAVNLWRGRDRGMWSDVIGVEGGGAVGYARALTNQQRMVLDDVRTKYGQWGFG